MKNLYNTKPLDDLERELLEDDMELTSIDNLETEKVRFQAIANSSIEKRQLVNEVINDKEFEPFIKVIVDNGLNAKDAFHNFFHKVANGSINPKILTTS